MFHVKRFLLLLTFLPIISFAQHFGSTTLLVKQLPNEPIKVEEIDRFLNDAPAFITLNSMQREWFYWTNYSRSNPKRFWDSVVSPILMVHPNLNNRYSKSLKEDLYSSPILPMLQPNLVLTRMAQIHASALASKKATPSHTSPNGRNFQQRVQDANIHRCAGENISFGPSTVLLSLVLLYIDEGVPDLGHRKSLLNPSFTEMGIGIGSYPENSYLIVQDFSCAQK